MAQPSESDSSSNAPQPKAVKNDPTGGKGSFALISDIHGNVDALKIVLADIKERGVNRICCLGDIIGYGPNPCECLDLVMGLLARSAILKGLPLQYGTSCDGL